MAEAIAACAASGTGIYAMKALAGGNLISSARESLRYVMGLPGVHGVALGMLSQQEIEANEQLFSTGVADADLWQGLEARKRHLRIMERFCKGCGQCVPSCASSSLSLKDGVATVDESTCVLCGYCGAACPEFIIRVV
jgi:ferredoxin